MSTRALGKETKYQKVYSDLERLANRLNPDEKLPSMRELIVSLDAGVNTLSGALNELEAKNIIYRRHGVGIFVSPRRAKNIWMICSPDFFSQGHSTFWEVLLGHSQQRAREKGENLSLHFALPEGSLGLALHASLVEEIQQGRVHGIIGIGLDHAAAHWFAEHGVPYTSFAGWAPYRVRLNEKSVVELGVKALVERGCRRIALWMPRTLEAVMVNRSLTAFTAALDAAGLVADPALIPEPMYAESAPPAPLYGQALVEQMFGVSVSAPDGILVTDDVLLPSALLALAQRGLRAGREVQLATQANRGTRVVSDEAGELSRIEFDPEEIASRIFEMLEMLMLGQTPTEVIPFADDGMVRLIEPVLAGSSRTEGN